MPWIALGRIAGAHADAPDVDIAAVDQPAFLSGRAVAAPDKMGHGLIKAPRDAAGKLPIYWGSGGAGLLGVVGVDRSGVRVRPDPAARELGPLLLTPKPNSALRRLKSEALHIIVPGMKQRMLTPIGP